MASSILNEIKSSFYMDSVALMLISQDLKKRENVEDAAIMMVTTANKKILADANLLIDEGRYAKTNDLLICVRASNQSAAKNALREAIEKLARPVTPGPSSEAGRPRSIRSALNANPDANLVLISVPGDFAAAEARKAIHRGLNVMLFSDNVSAEDELCLKILARKKGATITAAPLTSHVLLMSFSIIFCTLFISFSYLKRSGTFLIPNDIVHYATK